MSNINNVDVERLLSDKRVIAEIERHLWLESEKVGYDIGYERAQEEWLKNFSSAWMKYHGDDFINAQKAARRASSPSKTSKKNSVKRRRAKSYI